MQIIYIRAFPYAFLISSVSSYLNAIKVFVNIHRAETIISYDICEII